MTRLAEIRRRLANLDSVPADRTFDWVFEEFLDLARADMKYLLELYDADHLDLMLSVEEFTKQYIEPTVKAVLAEPE